MDTTPLFRHRTPWLGSALLVGIGLGALYGCDNPGSPAERVAEQCGLDIKCEAGGFAEGKASISGVASIDSFFGAAIDLDAAMKGLDGKLRGELDAIAASVGLEPGASGADIAGAVQGHLGLYVDGGLRIEVQPAKCEASVEASVAAAAECDAEVDPGMVSAKCTGKCELEASAGAMCSGDATLKCTGTAPQLDCSGGICSGSCVLDFSAAAECEGTCRGTCTVGSDEMTDFEGRCNGQCQGECAMDMSAGGSCDARCDGSCEYTPGSGGCEADATASCEAMADGSVECEGRCEGTVEPPSVSAECEATVEAKASASVECTPPTLDIAFDWNGDAQTSLEMQAEFRAWLEGFRVHFSALLAARVEAELIGEAALGLVASADGALLDAVMQLRGDANIKAAFGAKCALVELPIAAEALGSSQASLAASLGATVDFVGAF